MQADPLATKASPYPRWHSITALIVIGVLGASMSVLMPGLLGALVDERGITPRQAALIATAEMGGMTVATFIMAAIMGHIDRWKLVVAALAFAAVGDGIAAFSHGPLPLTASRLVAGIGEGSMLALMSAAAAGTRSPDRVFALLISSNMAWSALLFAALPDLRSAGGVTLLLLGFGIATLAAIALVPILPKAMPAAIAHSAQPRSSSIGAAALAGLIGTLFFFAGVGAVWPLMDRVGLASGIGSPQVSAALSIATAVGVLTGLFASWLGTRLGRQIPLLTGSLALILAMALIALGKGDPFAALAGLFMFAWVLSVPYYTGLMADLDPSGRLVALSIALQFCGMALGPLAASTVIGGNGYAGAGWVGAGLCAAGLLSMLIAAQRPTATPA